MKDTNVKKECPWCEIVSYVGKEETSCPNCSKNYQEATITK